MFIICSSFIQTFMCFICFVLGVIKYSTRFDASSKTIVFRNNVTKIMLNSRNPA